VSLVTSWSRWFLLCQPRCLEYCQAGNKFHTLIRIYSSFHKISGWQCGETEYDTLQKCWGRSPTTVVLLDHNSVCNISHICYILSVWDNLEHRLDLDVTWESLHNDRNPLNPFELTWWVTFTLFVPLAP
jgi:hypothetical protein